MTVTTSKSGKKFALPKNTHHNNSKLKIIILPTTSILAGLLMVVVGTQGMEGDVQLLVWLPSLALHW